MIKNSRMHRLIAVQKLSLSLCVDRTREKESKNKNKLILSIYATHCADIHTIVSKAFVCIQNSRFITCATMIQHVITRIRNYFSNCIQFTVGVGKCSSRNHSSQRINNVYSDIVCTIPEYN